MYPNFEKFEEKCFIQLSPLSITILCSIDGVLSKVLDGFIAHCEDSIAEKVKKENWQVKIDLIEEIIHIIKEIIFWN